MYLTTFIYNTLFLFLITKFFLCYLFTSQMMSTNSYFSFKSICLYHGISAWRYVPGISKVVMYLTSCASITNNPNRAWSDTVGDAKYYPSFKKFSCLLPFAQVRPLIVPVWFYFIRLTASKASLFSVLVNFVGSCGSTTGLFGIALLSS